MALCLLGAKPLPEPMLTYCRLDTQEQISVKFKSTLDKFSFMETHFDRLVQEKRNSIANALELRLFALTHQFENVVCKMTAILFRS